MKLTKILLPIVSSTILAIPPLTMATSCSNSKSLDDYSWEEIKELSKSGEASKYFKVGDTKKVQLKTQDLNNNGKIDEDEVYQTVRIIGFDQDYDRNVKRIGITFEFVDKISDGSGFALATYWNDYEGENKNFIDGLNYINSSVRKALIGNLAASDTQLNWFGYYGDGFPSLNQHFIKDTDPYYNLSVMDMLPDDLKASITPAYKIVNICTKDPVWSESDSKIIPPEFEQVQFVLDPLFLLSPCETGWEDTVECFQEPFQTPYQYYAGTSRESEKHIKAQLYKDSKHDSPVEALDGNFKKIPGQNSPYSYAGCSTTEGNDNAHWLRSPSNFTTYTEDDEDLTTVRPCAWAVKDFSGLILDYNIRSRAYGVAPAFCI